VAVIANRIAVVANIIAILKSIVSVSLYRLFGIWLGYSKYDIDIGMKSYAGPYTHTSGKDRAYAAFGLLSRQGQTSMWRNLNSFFLSHITILIYVK
jgi:hypothetical protein